MRWVEHGGFWHVDALLLIPAWGPIGGALGVVDDDGGVNLPDFNRKLRLGEI